MNASYTIKDILSSAGRARFPFKGERLLDALNFGFSYVESGDHIVEYVATNGRMAKRILSEIPESTVEPSEGFLGRLWTARLVVSDRLGDGQILFSNSTSSAVVDVKINPNNTDGE